MQMLRSHEVTGAKIARWIKCRRRTPLRHPIALSKLESPRATPLREGSAALIMVSIVVYVHQT